LAKHRANPLRFGRTGDFSVDLGRESNGRHSVLTNVSDQLLAEWVRKCGWIDEEQVDLNLLFTGTGNMANTFD